jgi:hypothetical protein
LWQNVDADFEADVDEIKGEVIHSNASVFIYDVLLVIRCLNILFKCLTIHTTFLSEIFKLIKYVLAKNCLKMM